MSEKEKAELMREFIKTFESNDFEKVASLCSDDIVVEMPLGTFQGKEEFKHCFNWMAENIKDFKVTEAGNGILVQGDKAFFEHTFFGIMQGEKAQFLAICAYEFSGDKINKVRTVYDRLSIAEQASSKWIEKNLSMQ